MLISLLRVCFSRVQPASLFRSSDRDLLRRISISSCRTYLSNSAFSLVLVDCLLRLVSIVRELALQPVRVIKVRAALFLILSSRLPVLVVKEAAVNEYSTTTRS